MAYTLTPNLKLRLDSNLTANSKYNLSRIDLLGSTFLVDSTNTLNIRSQTDISIEPESADIGGSAQGGTVSIGSPAHQVDSINLYGASVLVGGDLSLRDQATNGTKSLLLQYNSSLNGSPDTAADRSLSIDLEGADRSLVLAGSYTQLGGSLILNLSDDSNLTLPSSGVLATLSGTETLINKTIDSANNSILNIRDANVATTAGIVYSKLDLALSVRNGDIAVGAAVAYSKLSLTDGIVNGDINSSAAISYSKLNLGGNIVNADISNGAGIGYDKLQLTGSIQTGDLSPSLLLDGSQIDPNFLGQLILTDEALRLRNQNGVWTDLRPSESLSISHSLVLPSAIPQANQILRAIGGGDPYLLEWADVEGTGTVTDVSLTAPNDVFSVSGSPVTVSGTLGLEFRNQAANSFFAGPSTGSDNTPSFRTLTAEDIPSLDHGNLTGLADDDHTQYHNDSRALTWLGTRSTSDLTEGSNLYYTTERAQDDVGNIILSSATVDFAYDDAGPSITAEVIVSAVDHDQLLNFVTNEHINHSSVSITAPSDSGLLGGGDITVSRTLSIDPTNAPSAAPALDDIVLIGDSSSSSALARTTIQDILDLGSNSGGFAATWANADGDTKSVTHNLGTTDLIVQLYDLTTGETVYVDSVVRTDSNTLDLTANVAPATNWRILIQEI